MQSGGWSDDEFNSSFVGPAFGPYATGFDFKMVAKADGTLCEEDDGGVIPEVFKKQKFFCDTSGEPTDDSSTGKFFSAIGCIPINDAYEMIKFILPFLVGLSGGIAFLLIIIATVRIATSSGDPEKIKSAKELFMAGIGGLLLLIFSISIYRLVGTDILQLPGL